jgi:oxygen-dependent protoporphyrinogen oxidase
MQKSVAIIGSGVSGLAVAYELLQCAEKLDLGLRVACLENQDRPGGNIRSERLDEFLCEWGPNGFLDNVPATLDLVRRLGLRERMIRAEGQAERRFIFRAGRLRQVPTAPAAFLKSDVLSFKGKLRVFGEPFASRGNPDEDESVFEFAARRIGREAASILVDAMVSGVYAGDAQSLSLAATFPKMHEMERDHGSLFRAMLARKKQARAEGRQAGGPAGPGGRLTSFRDGLQELIDALVGAVGERLRLSCPVSAVSDMGQRGVRVHLSEGAPLEFDAMVMAAPAWAAARMVRTMDPEMAQAMEAIPPAPLAVVHMGYQEAALGDQPQGFGYLVPRGQGARILGSLWSSCIFKERAPKGRRLITSMIGGAHDPRAADLNDRKLIDIVRKDLQTTMGIITAPYFVKIFRHPRGIPQYTLGHLDRVARIEDRVSAHPGFWVSGNSYHGISVNACVEEAPRVADQVIRHLTN